MNNLYNSIASLAFTSLFLMMLSYWSQAAFFGEERYKTFNNLVFIFSISSLTTLLIIRWVESGHFPLSNLYESLLFLSWCFLSLKIGFGQGGRWLLQNKDTLVAKPSASFDKALSFEASLEVENAKLYDEAPTAFMQKAQNTLFSKDFFLHKEKNLHTSNLGLGVVLSPLAFLNFGFAFLSLPKEMQKATALVPALQSNWLMMHVTVMVLSYAALLSGSLLSVAFLILNFWRSPAIPNPFGVKTVQSSANKTELCTQEKEEVYSSLSARLDNLSYRILALGFPLLTIGILSGAVWANEAWGSYWSWDPKETWALITWLVFAIYLHTRITKGWSGQKPAIVASVGFFMVWFCYLGVNLLGTGLHSYGWFSQ